MTIKLTTGRKETKNSCFLAFVITACLILCTARLYPAKVKLRIHKRKRYTPKAMHLLHNVQLITGILAKVFITLNAFICQCVCIFFIQQEFYNSYKHETHLQNSILLGFVDNKLHSLTQQFSFPLVYVQQHVSAILHGHIRAVRTKYTRIQYSTKHFKSNELWYLRLRQNIENSQAELFCTLDKLLCLKYL